MASISFPAILRTTEDKLKKIILRTANIASRENDKPVVTLKKRYCEQKTHKIENSPIHELECQYGMFGL